ncbi:hypothetical protein EJB05_07503, partial [Eragrostis curvula]
MRKGGRGRSSRILVMSGGQEVEGQEAGGQVLDGQGNKDQDESASLVSAAKRKRPLATNPQKHPAAKKNECDEEKRKKRGALAKMNAAACGLPAARPAYSLTGGRGRPSSISEAPVEFNPHGVYRISDARNQLYVIGCDATAYIQSQKDNTIYGYEYFTGCVSYCRRLESVKNGSCAGVGCCRVDIPPNLTDNSVGMDDDDNQSLAVRPTIYDFSPCSYGFLVDRDSYTFSSADLKMDRKKMMPVWLDWAIRPNDSSKFNCSDAMKDSSSYACKSQNSICVDVVDSPGYICNCSRGYQGNAYIADGCTDIDECLHPETYPCFCVCHNTQGSYDCKCKRSSHGSPLQQPCDPDFSRAAMISIGVICGTSCLIALSMFMLMMNEKRKLRASFERNGGPLLARINNIKIFTKEEALEMYDTEIASPQNIEFLEKVGSIAVACLKEDMSKRPNMKQVAEHLQLVRKEWKQTAGEAWFKIAENTLMEVGIRAGWAVPTAREWGSDMVPYDTAALPSPCPSSPCRK